MQFSLILATLGRDVEVVRFLNSLKDQSYKNFELIVIDQNKDKKIDHIVTQFVDIFPIKHIKVNFTGLGKARDYGIKYVHGNIIGFPDDDCVYESDVLETVVGGFKQKKELSVLAGGAYDFDKVKFSVGGNSHKPMKFSSLRIMGIEFTHFFNLSRIKREDFYLDHDFGIGAKYFAGEGFEMLYRLLRRGNKAFYNPRIRIYHANAELKDYVTGGDRSVRYSFSTGAFIRKFFNEGDSVAIYYVLRKMFIAPVLKIILALCLLNFKKMNYLRRNLIGMWQGFLSYHK